MPSAIYEKQASVPTHMQETAELTGFQVCRIDKTSENTASQQIVGFKAMFCDAAHCTEQIYGTVRQQQPDRKVSCDYLEWGPGATMEHLEVGSTGAHISGISWKEAARDEKWQSQIDSSKQTTRVELDHDLGKPIGFRVYLSDDENYPGYPNVHQIGVKMLICADKGQSEGKVQLQRRVL